MITFEKVNKVYGNTKAVKDVSFNVREGEFLVLIGPSGSGKSTTMKMINQIIPHTSGKILFNGKPVANLNKADLRRSIGYVIQQIGLFPHYTIGENVAIVPGLKKWDKVRISERVDTLLEMVGLEPEIYRDRYPKQLSGGQQQRVGVARALASDPDIILMDEPFGALDPITRSQLQEELVALQRRLEKTIVFVTHDMDEALQLGDRIAIMREGELVQLDKPEEILQNPVNAFVKEFIGKGHLLKNPEFIGVTEVMKEKMIKTSPQRSPKEVLSLMRRNHLTNLPVVDDMGIFLGIVSAYDLVRHENKDDTIKDWTIEAELTLQVDATAKDAIQLISESKYGLIPVLDVNQKLKGVVDHKVLLSALSAQMTEEVEINS